MERHEFYIFYELKLLILFLDFPRGRYYDIPFVNLKFYLTQQNFNMNLRKLNFVITYSNHEKDEGFVRKRKLEQLD